MQMSSLDACILWDLKSLKRMQNVSVCVRVCMCACMRASVCLYVCFLRYVLWGGNK